ncbi:hypothetical protein BOTCAL_0448g00030 [Botryotinia calthae]|uniref:Uncharacterized protein n=1 Tax=Botryotinia calthae TaxID=38488 RepID=A0A4Y8CN39_9HELO|nr:hypothetical protein BOTCAL_0448g00030 [Botryotinia calthae]
MNSSSTFVLCAFNIKSFSDLQFFVTFKVVYLKLQLQLELASSNMKLNNNEVGGNYAEQVFDSKALKAATQQSAQSINILAQTQHTIHEHQKQIEDFQIKIQKHVRHIAALRQEEQALLKEKTNFEVGKIQRELYDIDMKNT